MKAMDSFLNEEESTFLRIKASVKMVMIGAVLNKVFRTPMGRYFNEPR